MSRSPISIFDASFDDEWLKAAKPRKPKPADGGGTFPKVLDTASVQWNMRQIPSRGMAELLQAYRLDPWMHRLLDIVGGAFASVPWRLYYRPDKSDASKRIKSIKHKALRGAEHWRTFRKAVDTGELKEIEENPVLDLLAEPNPAMSGHTFRDLGCKYYKMQGENYIYKRRDTFGVVYEMWPLSPTWIYRLPTVEDPEFHVSVLGRTVRVPATDMIWMKNLELLNPYTRGSGQGESLGAFIDTDEYLMQFQKAFFLNDAMPKTMAWIKGANQEIITDFQTKMTSAHQGPQHKHRMMAYGGPQEIEVHEFDVSKGIDSSMPLLNQIRDSFISVLGVPPERAGVLTSSNRSTIDAAQEILAINVTIPMCNFWLDEMTRQLLPDFDDRLLLGYDDPTPSDKTRQLAVLSAAPWIASAGEWRQLANLPKRSDKEDDFYMVPNTMTPVPDASVRQLPLAPHKLGDVQPKNNQTNVLPSVLPGSVEDLQSGVQNSNENEDSEDDQQTQRDQDAPIDPDEDSTPNNGKKRDFLRIRKDWDESQHPRDTNGEFGEEGGASSKIELSKTQKAALTSYVGGGYHDMNDVARGNISGLTKTEISKAQKSNIQLDAAIAGSKTLENETVYRGTAGISFDHLKEGTLFTAKGYYSTSSSKEVAKGFTHNEDDEDDDEGVLMKITIPKGTPALHVADHIKSPTTNREKEVLIGRNTKYRVKKVIKSGGRVTEIHMEVVS